MCKSLFSDFETGLETIDFQDDKFGKELDEFFEKLLLKCKIKSDVIKFTNTDLLSAIIKKHTNLKVLINVEDDNDYFASIQLPFINLNHFYLNQFEKTEGHSKYIAKCELPDLIKTIKENDGRAGVDTRNGKVYGAFQDVETTMFLPPSEILYQGLTNRELSAAVLHEIGHLFNYFRYFSNSCKTNMVLSFINRNMSIDKSFADRENILYKTMEVLGVNLTNVKDLAQECNTTKIILALSGQQTAEMHSELNSSYYDITANEQMADMFVARHGYGKEMVSNLSKASYWRREENTVMRNMRYLSLNNELFKSFFIGTLAVAGAATGAGVVTSVFIGFISIAYTTVLLFESKTNKQSFTYDTSLVRFKRIREQLISYLKTDRSKEKVKQITIDIKEIDYLISILLPQRTVFNIVADYLFSDSGQVRKTMVLQRELEELASNDLFVSAARLNHI